MAIFGCILFTLFILFDFNRLAQLNEVTDVNNCIESFDVSLIEPSELILQYTVYDATCEENNDGSILTNVSGGTMPYAYFWSNGLYDNDLYNLSKTLINFY